MPPILEAHGLTKRFKTTEALAGLDLVAERGQVTAAERVLGHGASYFATRSVVWCVLFIVVFAPLAARRYKRG